MSEFSKSLVREAIAVAGLGSGGVDRSAASSSRAARRGGWTVSSSAAAVRGVDVAAGRSAVGRWMGDSGVSAAGRNIWWCCSSNGELDPLRCDDVGCRDGEEGDN